MEFYFLTLSASILLLLYESKIVFYAALTIGTVISIYNLINLIRYTSYVRFGNLLATSLLFFYAGGGFVTLFGKLLIFGENLDPVNNHFGSYRQEHISLSLAFVFFTSAVLFLVSKAEKPIFTKADTIAPFTDQRVYRLLWLGFALEITSLLSGNMGYMGIQVNEVSKQITVLGSLAHLIAPIMVPITVLVYVREKVVWKRILLAIFFLFFLGITVILGRRVLLVTILLVLITIKLGSFRSNYLSSKSNRILFFFFGLIFLSIFAYFGSKFFYAMRLFIWYERDGVSLLKQLSGALAIFQNSSRAFGQAYLENSFERPFILSYLATLKAALDHHSPLFGYELANSFLISIPSLFFPGKMGILPVSQEAFVHPLFGLPVFDGPNTILTAGLDDFGLVGIILYPLLFIGIYYFFLRFFRRRLPITIYYLISFAMIYKILYVETSLSALLTVALRNIVILIVLCILVWSIPSFRIGSNSNILKS